MTATLSKRAVACVALMKEGAYWRSQLEGQYRGGEKFKYRLRSACLELPPRTPIGKGVSGWGETAGEALRQLREGMTDRINRHIPGYGKGRKWHFDWQRAMTQAAYQVNYPRLVITWLPADLMKIPRFRERVEYGRAA